MLDYPDNIEEKFRTILNKQNDKTLTELSNQSKQEIQSFLLNNRKTEKFSKKEKQSEKHEVINLHISKIKNTFTPELLNKNPDIAQNFEALDLAKTPQEKEAILRDIINILKEP